MQLVLLRPSQAPAERHGLLDEGSQERLLERATHAHVQGRRLALHHGLEGPGVGDLDRELALVESRGERLGDRPVHKGDLLGPVLGLRAQGRRGGLGVLVHDRENGPCALRVLGAGGAERERPDAAHHDLERGGEDPVDERPLRVRGVPGGEQELPALAGQHDGRELGALVGLRGLLARERRVRRGLEGVEQRGRGDGHLGEGVQQRLTAVERGHELLGRGGVVDLDGGELDDRAVGRGGLVRRVPGGGPVVRLLVLGLPGQARQHAAAGEQEGRCRQHHAAAGEGHGGAAGRASGRHGALS